MKKRLWRMTEIGLLGLCALVCQPRAKAQVRYLAQAPARSNCGTPLPGARIFSGQIQGTPSVGTFLVRNGSTSVWITYNNSVLVCQDQQPVSVNVLAAGTTVTVSGQLARGPRGLQMAAQKIQIQGTPAYATRTYSPAPTGAPSQAPPPPEYPGASTAKASNFHANYGAPAYAPTAQPNNGNSSSSPSGSTTTNSVSGKVSYGQSPGGNSGSLAISCTLFRLDASGVTQSGPSLQTTKVTCRKPIDQMSRRLLHDMVVGRSMQSVTLTLISESPSSGKYNWNSSYRLPLANVTISNIDQLTPNLNSQPGSQQMEDITFQSRGSTRGP